MISVSEARQFISNYTGRSSVVTLPLVEAAGLTLAADIFSPVDVPFFHQSAMDGYAFCYQHWQQQPLSVTAHIPAGSWHTQQLAAQQAARIYTGAALPIGADTVVMQEKTQLAGQLLHITDEQLQQGSNVRPRGSEIGKGALALHAGTYLNAAAIGFLANLGIACVPVHRKLKVSIIVTGNELLQPGNSISHGQVYESNSFMLTAALQNLPVIQLATQYVQDDVPATISAIQAALLYSDMVLLTGGVSAGDYDYVAAAMQACGVQQVFHKIKQKPGKPLLFGQKAHQLLFGLPGNPASVLTCFYEYVLPAIEAMTGQPHRRVQQVQRRLSDTVYKKAGLTHFMKAVCDDVQVTVSQAQESYRLSSFATVNCLLVMEDEATCYEKGELVNVHVLPTTI
ncbi:molybdopterin molybdochelatase [Filimonas lacunae]|uniref:Molybdopterin molybdenumtransferase n=1 Tax=Filimonas lacunae TaxID=477680 RepID=A0A173MGD3_9BACT|nr:gephyrin-like molybdotransferase Glp [Filimonas lacunae]BAV06549.1 molybdopterin biosynthesis protein MoeA [Filimonas lacunae]SIT27352.1 molybdopterin molybdochelatase [Filimonas lacunae]